MSTLTSARAPQPVRLKVTLLSLPPRTQAVLEYFFAGAGRSAFAPSAEMVADAAIFDHDNPDSRAHWEAFHNASGRPGILLSVQAQDVPDTVWVQKPATPAALVGAAARLTGGELARRAAPAADAAPAAAQALAREPAQGPAPAPVSAPVPVPAPTLPAATPAPVIAGPAPAAAMPMVAAPAAMASATAGSGGTVGSVSAAPAFAARLLPEATRPAPVSGAPVTAVPLDVVPLAHMLARVAPAAGEPGEAAPAMAPVSPATAAAIAAQGTLPELVPPPPLALDPIEAPAAPPPAALAPAPAPPSVSADAVPAAAAHPRVSLLDPLDELQIFGAAAAAEAHAANGRVDPQQTFFSVKGTLQEAVGEAFRAARKWNGLTLLDTPAGSLILDAPANRAYLGFDPAQLNPMCLTPLAEPLRVQMLAQRDLARMKEEPGRLVISEHADALVWRIAVLTSRGRLPLGTNTDAMLYLRRWPNITRLPHTPEALRVSALLAVRGASLVEAVRLLGIPQRYVFATYTALAALDLITQDGSHLKRRQRKGPKNRTLITRLFRWLSGKG